MTVAARSAKVATVPAYELRSRNAVRAGSFPHEGEDIDTGWHTHPMHQVQYAVAGSAQVETAASRYLLPPQQALWIPAGLPHRTTLRSVRSFSVFFAPELVPTTTADARVLAAAPVIREMLVYAARWPITREASDPVADAYFHALAVLVADWIEHEAPLRLPTSTDPLVAEVMAYTDAHLGAPVTEVCRAVGLSERTLRRRFQEDAGISWRRYRLQSRLLRSMVLLADGHGSVLDAATAVGFESVSAFSRAFFQATGETPTAYRRRVAS